MPASARERPGAAELRAFLHQKAARRRVIPTGAGERSFWRKYRRSAADIWGISPESRFVWEIGKKFYPPCYFFGRTVR